MSKPNPLNPPKTPTTDSRIKLHELLDLIREIDGQRSRRSRRSFLAIHRRRTLPPVEPTPVVLPATLAEIVHTQIELHELVSRYEFFAVAPSTGVNLVFHLIDPIP